MVVLSQGSLDTVCTCITSPDPMHANEPSWRSWTFHLLQILLRSHGFPPRAVDAELSAAEAVVAAPDPDLQRLCSGGDIPAE